MERDISTRLAQYAVAEKKLMHGRPNGPCILAYIRVSSRKQLEHGHSLAGQREIIDNYLARDDKLSKLPILYYPDEAKSGKNMANREKFEEMRETMKKGDIIITWNLSRLGRNTKEMINFVSSLREKGIGLILTDIKFDTTSSIGEMLLTLLIAVSQFERQQCSERTKAIMQQRKEEGYAITRPPYGYDVNKETKKLIPNEDEQKIINLITGWIYEDRSIKTAEITRRLQERFDAGEIVMRKAKKVHQATVSNIIKRNKLREEIEKHTQ